MARKKRGNRPERHSPLERIGSWLVGHERYLIIAILVSYVLFSALLFDPKPFVGGDNATYVILSQALVAGKGLVELWTPEQRPHTQYPFGFPLLLTPISLLKLSYVWYKLVPWLCGLAGIMLAWLLLRKISIILSLTIAFLLAINIHYIEYGHWVLSELPFLAFVLLTLFLLQRWEATLKWPWFLLLVLSAVAAIHIRTAGVALLPAVFLYLIFRRKYLWAGIFAVSCLILLAPWSLRNMHHGMSGGYLDQFLMRDPYQPALGRAGLHEMANRAVTNLKLYLGFIWPQMMVPMGSPTGSSSAGWLLFVFVSLPVLIGAMWHIGAGRAEGWLAFCYLSLSILWPEAWTDLRFSLPLLPVYLWCLFQGYRYLGRLMAPKYPEAMAVLAFIIIAINSLFGLVPRASNNVAMLSHYLRGERLSGYELQWQGFFKAAEWVRDNTNSQSIVVSRKPQLFYLISGRRSYCYPFTTDADSMARSLARADYVMIEPISGTLQRYLIPAIEPWLDKRFKIVHGMGNPPTYVLRVLKEELHGP